MQAFRDVAVLRPVFDAVGSDTDPAVAAKACAVLCNLVTFDATLKKEVISNLCARNMRNHIFDSRGEELRHNALLFFKNLSYEAPVFVIKDVLQTLNLVRSRRATLRSPSVSHASHASICMPVSLLTAIACRQSI